MSGYVLERTAAFTPRALGGLALWLEAPRIGGLADGDPVATWPDLSGSGRDASQGTASKRPTFRAGVLNGLAAVRFDGVDDVLATAAVATSSPTYTMVALLRFASLAARQQPLFNGNNSTANGYALELTTGGGGSRGVYHRGAAASLVDGAASAGWELWSAVRPSGGPVGFYLNGAAQSITNASATVSVPTTRTCIGGADTTPSLPFNGDLAAVLL